jgi:superfamily II RNA helicase
MDKVGYVFSQVVPEATDPREIERILYGKNERIVSRFSVAYSTILNLYSQFGEGVLDIFRLSLANFKNDEFAFTKAYVREEEQIKARIRFLQNDGFLEGTALTEKGKLAAAVSGYEIQAAELYFTRSFDELKPEHLPVVLGAIITEPNRNRRMAEPTDIRLRFEAERVIARLRRHELRHGIANPIREMSFSLAAPIFAWASGCSLKDLSGFGVPEGDLIRILRMAVQLLRTLRDRIPDPVISDRMHDAMVLINRDVVDAQAELEVE